MKKLSILCFIFPLLVFSQEEDFQSWNKIELGYKIHKNISLNFTEGLRLRENASLPSKTFTNLGIGYRHNKKWRFAIGYRFIQFFDISQEIHLRHRWYADIINRKKMQRFQLSFRSRLQHQLGSNYLEQYYRGRLKVAYNIRKTPLDPSLSIETFCNLSVLELDKMRYTLTASYPLSKKIDGILFYRLQQEINVSNPSHFYIMGAGASLDF